MKVFTFKADDGILDRIDKGLIRFFRFKAFHRDTILAEEVNPRAEEFFLLRDETYCPWSLKNSCDAGGLGCAHPI